jgi:hypothetical protein
VKPDAFAIMFQWSVLSQPNGHSNAVAAAVCSAPAEAVYTSAREGSEASDMCWVRRGIGSGAVGVEIVVMRKYAAEGAWGRDYR